MLFKYECKLLLVIKCEFKKIGIKLLFLNITNKINVGIGISEQGDFRVILIKLRIVISVTRGTFENI